MSQPDRDEQRFIVIPTDGNPIFINVDSQQLPPIEACPVTKGKPAYWDRCGGGWDGTRMKTADLTFVTYTGRIDLKKIACQPIQDRVREGLVRARTIFEF